MSNEPINREVAFAGQQVRRKVILALTLCSIIPLLLITYAFNSPVREFLGPLAGLADSVSIPAIMVFTLLLMLGGAFVVWDIATALSRAAHLSNQARPDLTAAESGRKDEIGTLMNSFARMLEYLGLYIGTVTAFAQSIDTLAADMGEARPDYVPAVPRVFEKLYARILSTRESSSALRRAVFDGALAVGRRWSAHVQRQDPIPPALQLLHVVAHRLVYQKIHHVLGGRVRYLVSGGAPLSQEIAEFFHAMGVLTLEGYGLTETTPVLTVNQPSAFKFGTVGRPLSGVEVRIAADGEIVARGPNVARGYHRRPVETAAAWDGDGWFHTGDIGEIDADGFLRITDRKKDLLKTSGGKYVAPQKIENALKNQPHVSQAVVIGDGRKYCVGLITLDVDAVRAGLPA